MRTDGAQGEVQRGVVGEWLGEGQERDEDGSLANGAPDEVALVDETIAQLVRVGASPEPVLDP